MNNSKKIDQSAETFWKKTRGRGFGNDDGNPKFSCGKVMRTLCNLSKSIFMSR